MSVVDQFQVLVVDEEFGCADCLVFSGDVLCFVKQVGEGQVFLPDELYHFVGCVFGIAFWVVGVDCDEGDASWLIFLGNTDQLIQDMFDVWAVVAHEDDDGAAFAFQFVQGAHLVGGGFQQFKGDGRCSQWEGFAGKCHDSAVFQTAFLFR